ncbi:MAG TPA: YaeQ family protein [Polyangiales bacterium]|nr:YaeQ family protein [Polyangiales bacterium]
MALGSTVHRFKVQLSDADRGVYEQLDLRAAQHPSETPAYLVTRLLAYCLSYEEGITFTQGLQNTEQPAIWIKTPDERTIAWIEIGTPSAERLHKASKACPRVIVYTHHDPQLLRREAARSAIHRIDQIEVFAPASTLVQQLVDRLERNITWELVRSGGQLYVTVAGTTVEGELQQLSLAP